jgi:hypothetical protein
VAVRIGEHVLSVTAKGDYRIDGVPDNPEIDTLSGYKVKVRKLTTPNTNTNLNRTMYRIYLEEEESIKIRIINEYNLDATVDVHPGGSFDDSSGLMGEKIPIW